jgi:hypothetical protein
VFRGGGFVEQVPRERQRRDDVGGEQLRVAHLPSP